MLWGKIELVWTYIQFFFQEGEKADQDIDMISAAAARLMEFNPDEQKKETIVMKVLKTAKASKRWDLVNEWALKIDPEALDSRPREINGRDSHPLDNATLLSRSDGSPGLLRSETL